MTRQKKLFSQVAKLRERYHKQATKKHALLQLIDETEIAEHVYNSNAIENSTLSLEETEKILLQMDLDRFVQERELFEAKNLARVSTYIRNKAHEKILDIDTILLLHKMLLSNIREDIAGRFRKENEFVRVANHIAPPPKYILKNVEDMLSEYYGNTTDSIITKIARFHLSFEDTHPFVDGNGRIGRAANNFLLIRDGYVPINIQYIDRAAYFSAFREFESYGKTDEMEDIVGKALCNSFHKRLAYLEEKEIIPLNTFAKRNRFSHSNLINKAHRQTIEAFLEKGIWKIGA